MLEFLLGACFFLCIFAPFTFVIFLIDAIKKVVSGDGNESFPRSGRRAKPVYHAGRDLLCAFMNAQN